MRASYIRRSVVSEGNPGDVSREVQEEAIRKLAKADGYDGELMEFIDWGRSADEAKTHRRTAFLDLLRAIENDRIDTVYAYAADRLYRSMVTYSRLATSAKEHGVRIITSRDGLLGGDGSPMAVAFGAIGAVFAEMELNTAKARARANHEARRLRVEASNGALKIGLPLYGELPGEDLPAVIAAFREAGSYNGAAKLLNQRGLRTRFNRYWAGVTIRSILSRAIPNELPRTPKAGARSMSTKRYARLLRCWCGHTLTPAIFRPPEAHPEWASYTLYRCFFASRTDFRQRRGPGDPEPSHRRQSVKESVITEWLRSELRMLDPIRDTVADTAATIADFDEQLKRAGRAFTKGSLTEAEHDELVVEITADKERLGLRDRIQALPDMDIDLDGDPADINRLLRLLIDYIQLDEQLQPVSVKWSIPELRSSNR